MPSRRELEPEIVVLEFGIAEVEVGRELGWIGELGLMVQGMAGRRRLVLERMGLGEASSGLGNGLAVEQFALGIVRQWSRLV